ncbi:MAG: hypothetical protein NXI02_13000, partial [Rhodobacteraceae bacterium]|nr:hypothetical protein [Paracoccaceae bacterium]
LGERGMWFKKHFFEKALRVPLIVKAPWIAAQRVSELTSLVDLLPTFGSLAGSPAPVEPLEGIDLMDLLDKGNPPPQRPVYAEYLAEATPAPIFMIRRQNHKFISSSHDGIMLFDLAADPDELTNLATSEVHQPLVEAFCEEVRIKWNETELVDAILLSQKRRALVRDAMNTGQKHLWNHGEKETDSVLWYRGVQGYNEWAFDYI